MATKNKGFAHGTKVPVEKTRMEIERTVSKYGADAFATMHDASAQMVAFRIHNLNVRFTVPIPNRKDIYNASRYAISGSELDRAVAAETRRRWRALLLSIKAKLEMVDSGLACFEEEFLAHVVTPSGKTIGETLVPQIEQIQRGDVLPLIGGPSRPALPAPPTDEVEVVEAERIDRDD